MNYRYSKEEPDEKINIVIHLSSRLISEAIYHLLVGNGYDDVIISGSPHTDRPAPHVRLVDMTTFNRNLLAQHPHEKFLLIDTGIDPRKIIAMLLDHKIHGVLSPNTELPLFKKALKVVSDGQVWIDEGTVKSSLRDAGVISATGKINGITGREEEIIECVRRGLSNKEIAKRLALSENTVKTHLYNIFTKFNITSRTKLISLVTNSRGGLST